MGHHESFAQAHKREHGVTFRWQLSSGPPLIRLLLSLIVVAILCSCGARDASYNPAHFHLDQVLVPPDVSPPPGVRAGTEVDGLFPISSTSSSSICCFIAPLARLSVIKDREAHWLQVGTYVSGAARHLQIRFPDGSVRSIANLGNGGHSNRVAIPPALVAKKGNIDVEIRAVPEGTRVDVASQRGYALILVSLYFE